MRGGRSSRRSAATYVAASCPNCDTAVTGLRCPVCDTRIPPTNQTPLKYSSPKWIRSLAGGIDWVIWGSAAEVVIALASAVVHAKVVTLPLSILAIVPFYYGLWRVTSPQSGERLHWDARRLARAFIPLTVLTVSLGAAHEIIHPAYGSPLHIAFVVIRILATLAVLAANIAWIVYSRRMAMRMSNERLAGAVLFVVYVVLAPVAVALLTIPVVLLFDDPRLPAGGSAGVYIYIALLMAKVVYLIWFLVLYFRLAIWFRIELRKQADLAARLRKRAKMMAASAAG